MKVTEKFKVTGMSCSVCSAHVKKATESVSGVESCSVNLTNKSMLVTYDNESAKASDIVKAVKKAGYGVQINGEEKGSKGKNLRLVLSVLLLLVLMYISMGHMFNAPLPNILAREHNPIYFSLSQLVLSAVVISLNFPFVWAGVKSGIKLAPTMNTLVAVGVFASFGYGVYTLLGIVNAPSVDESVRLAKNLYFESSATILTVVSFGKFLEEKNKIKTNSALSALVSMTPKTANVFVDGEIVTVSAEEIQKGQTVVLKNGDVVPVDGVVVNGNGYIDTSAMTGESVPAFSDVGDEIISSSVVTDGYIEMRAEAVGEDTSFSRLISLMEAAGASKVPLARVADKVSAVFVPAIFIISLLTLIVHLIVNDVSTALNCAISVLVVSCPCALGLATPAAVAVGCGEAARRGILIKDAGSFENMAKSHTVILDKTGTITKGKMHVDSIRVFDGEKDELLKCASSVESLSSHPLSRAVSEYYIGEKCEVKDFESIPGKGVIGQCDGKKIILGNQALLIENNVDLSNLKNESFGSSSPIFMSVDGTLSCVFLIKDEIKEDAEKSVKSLYEFGLNVVMVTGDRAETAESVAQKVGIKEVFSGVLPGQKEEYVKKYKKEGVVIMVGDGINDSVALASADTGIAIGTGTAAASCSADVILINGNLDGVVNAVTLGKKVLANIKMNLFWAFFYNVIGIPIAAGVFMSFGLVLSPMIAAMAMSLSSLFVVLNALRIKISKK